MLLPVEKHRKSAPLSIQPCLPHRPYSLWVAKASVIDLSDHADIGAFAYADRAGILRLPAQHRVAIAIRSLCHLARA